MRRLNKYLSVCVNRYDFEDAFRLLEHLDTELPKRNPGAIELLEGKGVSIDHMSFVLTQIIPDIISVAFFASGSKNAIAGAVLDTVARGLPPLPSFQTLFSAREARLSLCNSDDPCVPLRRRQCAGRRQRSLTTPPWDLPSGSESGTCPQLGGLG